MRKLALPVVPLWLLLGSCGQQQEPSPPPEAPNPAAVAVGPMEDAQARARALDGRRDGMQAAPGTFSDAGATSRFVAYRDSGVLRLIDERSDFGEYGSGAARYYLDNTEALLLYEASDEDADPAQPGVRRTTRMRLVFDVDGRMLASEKTVDDRVQPVLATEIEGVRRHFAALRQAAGAR
jgi:hypothetical protein